MWQLLNLSMKLLICLELLQMSIIHWSWLVLVLVNHRVTYLRNWSLLMSLLISLLMFLLISLLISQLYHLYIPCSSCSFITLSFISLCNTPCNKSDDSTTNAATATAAYTTPHSSTITILFSSTSLVIYTTLSRIRALRLITLPLWVIAI